MALGSLQNIIFNFMQPSTQSQNMMRSLRENWFLVLFIGSLIIGWSNFSSRLNATEKAQAEQKQDINILTSKSNELQGAIIEIKANYLFIKSLLEEIKTKR